MSLIRDLVLHGHTVSNCQKDKKAELRLLTINKVRYYLPKQTN